MSSWKNLLLREFLVLLVVLSSATCYNFVGSNYNFGGNFGPSSRDPLHNLMDEPELAYYFQGKTEPLPDYQLVYLPLVEELPNREKEVLDYEFTAFGQPLSLRLKRNSKLLAPSFKTFISEGERSERVFLTPGDCHFLHRDVNSVAALSLCDDRQIQGLIFLKNTTVEVHPLTPRLRNLLKLREPLLEESSQNLVPHLVKRASNLDFPLEDSLWQGNFLQKRSFDSSDEPEGEIMTKREISTRRGIMEKREIKTKRGSKAPLTLELALFFDEAAYKIFSPYLNHDNQKLQDMILAYLNGVQALYHHPSLGTSLDLVLVRLDIMKKQSSGMYHHEGERSKLLDSFCAYQSSLNPESDSDPDHWDMGLYVSGLDFYAIENGKKSGVTMGLATVAGVCLAQYACIIAELGTTNVFGKPYPSAGFTSVYILAHEIGHNLGMHHDSSGNSCPKEGFIMSPSRGTSGETQWSTCSAQVMASLGWATCLKDSATTPHKNLDHGKFLNVPGQKYTAKKQCEILLRDKDAVVSPSQQQESICYNLQCKTPHRSGFYHAGPALEGTECGRGKYCYGGDCVKKTPPKPVKVVPGGWGPWKEGTCISSCIEKSKGYQGRRRSCNNPVPVNTDKGCEGASYDVVLCKDDKVCGSTEKRKPVNDFASEKCKEFSLLLPQLDGTGVGLQAPHEEGRLWMGCAIFCRRHDTGSFYTPRLELNDLGLDPYFPDGTWCNSDSTGNYYCLQHHCLPEGFKLSKSDYLEEMGEDVPFSQNAHPFGSVPPGLESYLSLHPDGKPMQTNLEPGEDLGPKEEDWETDDYVELPQNQIYM